MLRMCRVDLVALSIRKIDRQSKVVIPLRRQPLIPPAYNRGHLWYLVRHALQCLYHTLHLCICSLGDQLEHTLWRTVTVGPTATRPSLETRP